MRDFLIFAFCQVDRVFPGENYNILFPGYFFAVRKQSERLSITKKLHIISYSKFHKLERNCFVFQWRWLNSPFNHRIRKHFENENFENFFNVSNWTQETHCTKDKIILLDPAMSGLASVGTFVLTVFIFKVLILSLISVLWGNFETSSYVDHPDLYCCCVINKGNFFVLHFVTTDV